MMLAAKYPGTCACCGEPFNAGDWINYQRSTKEVIACPNCHEQEPWDYEQDERGADYGGRRYYQNPKGICEDAPCCGCCGLY